MLPLAPSAEALLGQGVPQVAADIDGAHLATAAVSFRAALYAMRKKRRR